MTYRGYGRSAWRKLSLTGLIVAFFATFFASLISAEVFALDPPTISGVSPASGYNTGGDTVTITGSGFAAGVEVSFSGTNSSTVSVIDANTITAVAPAQTVIGTVELQVKNTDGQTTSSTFTYIQPAPTITSVSPTRGPIAGGNRITISGSGYYQDLQFQKISAGDAHSCGISSGRVYCWGINTNGQLGNNSTTQSLVPVIVATVGTPMAGKTIVAVDAGINFTLALDNNGVVYAWGGNGNGQLGNTSTTQSLVPVAVTTSGALSGKKIKAISASNGTNHALALASDGTVYSWGLNTNGQLGNNSTTQSTSPVAVVATGVLSGKTITAISTGSGFSSALASDGTAYSWGNNGNGQLGNTSTTQSLVPVAVTTSGALSGKTLTAISSGLAFSIALASDGTAYTWGLNTNGQLGNNSTVQSTSPVAVNTAGVLAGKTLASISTGNNHALVIDTAGVAYSWGYNLYGQLGNNSATQSTIPVVVNTTGALSGKTLTSMNGGLNYSLALDTAGKIYGWGINTSGQIGNGVTANSTLLAASHVNTIILPIVTTVGGSAATITNQTASTITAISPAHAAGLVDVTLSATNMDSVSAANSYEFTAAPQLTSISPNSASNTGGDTVTITGSDFLSGATVKVGASSPVTATYIDASTLQFTVPASQQSGVLPLVVKNIDGQTATGTFTYIRPGPTVTTISPDKGTVAGGQAVTLSGSNYYYGLQFTQISASKLGGHVCGVANARAYCWGLNTNGQLGNNSTTQSLVPVAVATNGTPMAGKTIVAISTGTSFSVAVASDGTVYSWGLNTNGQLGNNSTTQSLVPVAVNTAGVLAGKTVTAVSAGESFVLALASDGVVYSWGLNSSGQLGNNSTTQSTVPVAVNTAGVLSGKTIISIGAGQQHSGVVATDGNVYMWGSGLNGRLGNSGTSQANVPVAATRVGTPIENRRIVAISLGQSHTIVLSSDGFVFGWGSNGGGPLGDGTTNTVTSAVATQTSGTPMAGKNIVGISTGQAHTVALDSNGVVYAWGTGTSGQLGNNGTSTSLVPIAVTTAATPMTGKTLDILAAGYTQSFAIGSDGSLYGWGTNNTGQLGNNSTSFSLIPLLSASAQLALPVTASFGGSTATITGQTANSLTVTSPAHAAGAVDVVLASDMAETRTVGSGYLYLEAPTISSVTPGSGSVAGGDTITISGTAFRPASTVWFNDTQAASVTYVNATTLTVVAPAGIGSGGANVRVINDDGQAITSYLAYEYMEGGASISTVSPAQGPTSGGNTVTINGGGLAITARFKQVVSGTSHTCGLTEAGKVYCWGRNNYGQLGDGTNTDSALPVAVTTSGVLAGKTIAKITAGSGSILALDTNGKLYAWGFNAFNALGDNSSSNRNTPVAVYDAGVLAGKTIIDMAISYANGVAVDSNGKVYTWGFGSQGQLGNNLTANSMVPIDISSFGALAGKVITNVTTGGNSTASFMAALDNTGKVYTWGYNNGGQLGNNSTTQSNIPVAVNTTGALSGKTIVAISANGSSTTQFMVALDSNGAAYAWGASTNGQTGANNLATNMLPLAVPTTGVLAGKTLVKIATGSSHVVVTDTNNITYAWGGNRYGQLGNNASLSVSPYAQNAAVVTQTNVPYSAIAGGESHSCGVGYDGAIYCWGLNDYSQLGDTTITTRLTPVFANRSTISSESIFSGVKFGTVAATITSASSSAITVTAPAHVAGTVDVVLESSYASPLTASAAYTYVNPPSLTSVSPTSVLNTGGDTITISGNDFMAGAVVKIGGITASSSVINSNTILAQAPAMTTVGSVDIRVENTDGQVATNSVEYHQAAPMIGSFTPSRGPITGQSVNISGSGFYRDLRFQQISTGDTHSCGVSAGKVYCWGANNAGQLGNNSIVDSNKPVAVVTDGTPMQGKRIVAVSAGAIHTLALDSNGTVYGWGSNNNGRLGDASTTQRNTPVAVSTSGVLAGKTISKIAAGGSFSTALATDGTLYSWGYNLNGQLGNNSTTQSTIPVAVVMNGVLAGKTITAIATGYTHVLALASDGTVYSWGYNTNGQLGNNSTTQSQVPVAVTTSGVLSGKTITKIAGGNSHSLAVSNDGAVYAWGYNNSGQLGNNSTTQSLVPVAVTTSGVLSGKTITSIAGGSSHSIAVDTNGAVYGWGMNSFGQLGNNSTSQSTVPVAVIASGALSGKTIVGVSGGSVFTLGIDSSGTVYGWGYNSSGQLGNNSTTQSNVPIVSSNGIALPLSVTFGGIAAAITASTPTSLTVSAPAHAAGFVTVEMTAPYVEAATAVDAFEYITAPVLTSISPTSGVLAGGNTVTVTGSNLSSGSTVYFGGIAAASTYVNGTTYSATVPAATAPGPVDVTITDSLGQSSTLAAAYTYRLSTPVVTSVTPAYLPMGGGTITIHGSNFVAKQGGGTWYEVNVDGIPATNVTYVNATTLTATAPTHSLGKAMVTVTSSLSDPGSLADAFTYLPASYAFTSSPLVIASGEAGMITIQARDLSGNPITSSEDITLDLSSSSPSGYFAHTLSGENIWLESTVVIPAGQSQASFYYKDNQQNSPTITVNDGASTSASQVQTVGPRYKLLVTGVTDPISAGVPSSVTIQAIDVNGEVQSDYTGTVSFTSSDPTALLPANYQVKVGDFGGHTFVNGVTLTTEGEQCITVTDVTYPSITGTQCEISVTPAGAGTVSQLDFITQPQSVPLNTTTSAITVQTQDSTGAPAATISNTTLYLYSSSATGQFSLNGTSGWQAANGFEVIIPQGTTSANVYYRDSVNGSYAITARDDLGMGADLGWTNATQSLVVGVGAPSRLDLAGPTVVPAGDWAALTLAIKDSAQNTVTSSRNIPIRVTTNSGTASLSANADGSGASQILDVIIPAGAQSITVYVRDTVNHQIVVSANDQSAAEFGTLTQDTHTMTTGPSPAIRVALLPRTTAAVYEQVSLTAYLQDEYGNTVIPDQNVDIDFSSNNASGGFNLVNAAPWNATITKTMLSGSSSAVVYYRDTQTGTATITAAVDGILPATNDITIAPQSYDPLNGGKFGFINAPTNYVASVAQTVTMGLFDQYNNATTSATDVTARFSAGSGEYSLDGTSWSAVLLATVPAGQAQLSVLYRSTVAGSVQQRIYQPGALAVTEATHNIVIAAAAPHHSVVMSDTQTIAKDTPSDPVVIELRDAFDNAAQAPAGFVLNLSSSSATGEFEVNSTWSAAPTLTVAEGASQVQFRYRDSVAGAPTLTIAKTGFTATTYDLTVVNSFISKTTIEAGTTTQAGVAIPLTITTRSADDIATPVSFEATFQLSGNGQYSLTEAPWSPITTVALAAGESSKALYYRSDQTGIETLTIAEMPSQGWLDASHDLTITSAPVYRYGMTTYPSTIPVTESSSTFTVSAYDAFGNVTPVESDATGYLYSNSNTGAFALSSTGPWTATSVVIPAGFSSASFNYKDTTLGASPTINVSDKQPLEDPDTGTVNASVTVSIVGQTPQKFAFLSTEQTVVAGELSELVTVQLQKADGTPAITGSDYLLNISGLSGDRFYSEFDTVQAVTSITIPSGTTTASFYVRGFSAGAHTIRASHSALTATQVMTVTPTAADSVRFTTAEQTVQAGEASGQITATLYDEFNNMTTAASNTTLTLTTSCGDGSFSLQTGSNWSSITEAGVPAGSQSATFYYQGTIAGTCALAASSSGLTTASQDINITAAPVERLEFTTLPATAVAGQTVNGRVSLLDRFGNQAIWIGATKTLYLESSSSTATISTGNTILIGAGSTGVSFTYRDTTVGMAAISVRDQSTVSPDSGWVDDSESITIGAGTPDSLVFSPNPLNITAGELRQLTVEARNEFGIPIVLTSSTPVYLSSSDTQGIFMASNDPSGEEISSITIPAGAQSATAYYTQTTAGEVTLTASTAANNMPVDGIDNAEIVATILPAEVVATEFATPPKEQMVNEPSSAIVIQAMDEFGNVTIFETATTLYLDTTSPTGTFSSSPTFASTTSTITAQAGSTAATFYYKDQTAGTHTITVSDEPEGVPSTGILGAAQDITIYNGEPAQLVFENAPTTLERGEISQAATVRIKNVFGATTSTDTDMTVYLTTNTNGQFALSPAGPWNVSQVTIPAGQTGVTVYYRNTQSVGAAAIRASDTVRAWGDSDSGLNDANHSLVVTAGAFAQLAFVTAPQTLPVKHSSDVMQVVALNKYGYETTVAADTRIYLRSTSVKGEFAATLASWGANYVTMTPNVGNRSVVSFYYRDTQTGIPTITASNSSQTSDTNAIRIQQQQTIIPQTHSGFRVVNISDPQYQGSPSSAVVSAIDNQGYVIDDYAGTITFSSSDPSAILPGSYTFNPVTDRGIHTFVNAVAFTSPGEKTVTVTDGNGISGSQTGITVIGGPVAAWERVAFIQPQTSLSVAKSTPSEPITVQLQAADETPFVAPAGGAQLRLSSQSATGQFALSQAGPWQNSLIATVPTGLSYLNVYYRDTTAGIATITAVDWESGTDSALIQNATLTVSVSELQLESQAVIRSKNYAGQLVQNPYLFSARSDGLIEGDVQVTYSAKDKTTGDSVLADWQLTFKKSQNVLNANNYFGVSTVQFASGALTATAGDDDFLLEGQANAVGETALIAHVIPVSPWRVGSVSVMLTTAEDALRVEITTLRNDLPTTAPSGFVTLLKDGQEVAGARITLANDAIDGGYLLEMPITSNAPAVYRVVVRLEEGQGNILAENISAPLSVGTNSTSNEEVPFGDAGGLTPIAPVVPPLDTPSVVAPQSPSRPSGSGVEQAASQNPIEAIVAIVAKALESPAAPYVFPLLLFVLIGVLILIFLAQIYLAVRRSRSIRDILAKEARIAHDKSEFLTIAAHYLRTPIAVIDGAVGLLQRTYAEGAAAIAGFATSLREKAELLLGQTEQDEAMKDIEKPQLARISATIYRSPLFWLPVITSVAMTILINWAIFAVGNHVTTVAYAEQILLIAIGALLLYVAVHQRYTRREYKNLLQSALAHRKTLDEAKNQFVTRAYNDLTGDIVQIVTIKNQLNPQDPAVAILNDGTTRLLSLMAKFQTLATINTLQVHPAAFSSEQLIDISVAAFQQQASQKEVAIEAQVPPVTLVQDAQLLIGVMKSVIDNAVKFSPNKGKVSIKARRLKREMVFTVTDHGQGFSEDPEALIGLFERGEAAQSVDHEGAGLSLYLNRIVMESLGGSIQIKNGQNNGAKVSLRIPLRAQTA